MCALNSTTSTRTTSVELELDKLIQKRYLVCVSFRSPLLAPLGWCESSWSARQAEPFRVNVRSTNASRRSSSEKFPTPQQISDKKRSGFLSSLLFLFLTAISPLTTHAVQAYSCTTVGVQWGRHLGLLVVRISSVCTQCRWTVDNKLTVGYIYNCVRAETWQRVRQYRAHRDFKRGGPCFQ